MKMEPIKISVEVSLNLSEKTQDFLKSIFAGTSISAAPAPVSASAPAKPAAPVAPAPTPAKPAVSVAPAPAPAKLAAPAAPAKPSAPASSISIEDVRKALSEKVNEHRAEIKDKLNSFGAPSVTKLDPAKYQEMYDFLKAL